MTGLFARTEAPPPAVESWWAGALSLDERLAAGPPEPVDIRPDANGSAAGPYPDAEPYPDAAPYPDAGVDARIERWRRICDLAGPGQFAGRLAEAGTDESGLRALLAEPVAALGARTARPAWAAFVADALRIPPLATVAPATVAPATVAPATVAPAMVDAEPSGPEATGSEVFAGLLHPFVEAARRRLAERRLPETVDDTALYEDFATWLGARLVAMAAPTLVEELHAAAAGGELAGVDGRDRFADFVRQLAMPGRLVTLFSKYPVLGQLIGQTAEQAVASRRELLGRYGDDRAAIVAELLGGRDPGRLVAIAELGADSHRGGRAVAALVFADGRRVVYKPRTVEAYAGLAALVRWLNSALPGTDLRTPALLVRDGYGWSEFVTSAPLSDHAGADRFYRRQGALLALLQLVWAVDIHHENVVACGEYPVVVDAETIFHPMTFRPGLAGAGGKAGPTGPRDPAADRLASSVYRTGVLPQMLVGEQGRADISALGGDGATPTGVLCWADAGTDRMRLTRRPAPLVRRGNRAHLDGVDCDPSDHEPALLAGFRAAYRAISEGRAAVGALLRGCADVETRVVVRPTQLYRTLLGRSRDPVALRDALDRDRELDALWPVAATLPGSVALVPHELRELRTGDVPLFTTTPAGTEVRTVDGSRVAGVFDRPALVGVLEQLDAMSDANLRDQEWIISATVATRREPTGHRDGAGAEARDSAVEPARLLAGARGIADQLVALAARSDDQVNWLGLELVDERQWLVLPMGAGLATGYPGVALFLAEIWALTGVERYAATARAALGRMPYLLAALSRDDAAVRAVGCGGLTGFGGIAYALARLANRLGDAEPQDWTRTAIVLAGRSLHPDAAPGVFTGLAGCLATMTAVHEELGLPEATATARRCAALLADRADVPDPAGGFAAGAVGVGWALARYAGSTAAGADAARCAVLGSRLLRADTTGGDGYGWCSGRAGVHAARYAVGGDDDPGMWAEYARRPVLRDLSLCHGELGIIEALAVRREPQAARIRHRMAGRVVGAIARTGPGCGTPGGVPTPGLLNGLAGIGYGLLRAGFPEEVPSVLLLAASRREPAQE